MSYYGDYAEDYADMNIKFTTRQATGAPFTLGGTPAISVYKSNDLTQSTAGVTLTVDFDGVTGLNNVNIDLSADVFYATGEDYQVVITTGTVNSVSVVGEVIGEFSIQNRYMRGTDSAATAAALATVDANVDAILVDTGTTLEGHLTDIKGGTFSGATDSLEAIRDRGDAAWTTGAGGTPPQLLQSTTIATLATQTSFTLTAGSADNDAYNNAIAVITDQTTSTQKAVGAVSDYVGVTKTVTLSADPAIFTMAVGDTIEIIAALGSAGSAPTAVQIRQEIDTNSTQLAAIVADTNELQTDNVPGLIAALNNVAATDIVSGGAITTSAGAVANVDLVDTCTTNTDMRGTDSANTTAPDNTSIAAILTDTADMQPRITSMETDINNLDLGIIYSTAATGTLTTTSATTNLSGYADNQLIGAVIVVTSGAAEGERRDITNYTEIGGIIEFAAMTIAMAAGDTFKIV